MRQVKLGDLSVDLRKHRVWIVDANVAAIEPPADGDCPNVATVSLGNGEWHLCAGLPRFRRFRRRRPLAGANPHEQDAIAIRSDWESVGRDLAGVIGRKHGQG